MDSISNLDDVETLLQAFADHKAAASIPFEYHRPPEVLAAIKAASDYLVSLPLTHEQNDKMISLLTEQTIAAERAAFQAGGRLVESFGRWAAEQEAQGEET